MTDAPTIASLVPHADGMVLLDRVLSWTEQGVRCAAVSHRLAHNPLRRDGTLSAAAGLEYGAQAAAVHAALSGGSGAGLLAGARDLVWCRDRLDDQSADLVVSATRITIQAGMAVYRFRIDADVPTGGHEPAVEDDAADDGALVAGQVTIALDRGAAS